MKRIFVFPKCEARKPNIFKEGAKMSNIEEMKNQVSPEEVDAQIRKVIGYLVNEGAHVGCVSAV